MGILDGVINVFKLHGDDDYDDDFDDDFFDEEDDTDVKEEDIEEVE